MNANGNACAYPTGCDGDPGLTKRELIAAMAMQGILSNPTTRLNPINKGVEMSQEQMTALASLQIADALILELSKDQPK